MKHLKGGKRKPVKRTMNSAKAGFAPYPRKTESIAAKRERLDLCPECGADRACYSCASGGGWMSQVEAEEQERNQAMCPV